MFKKFALLADEAGDGSEGAGGGAPGGDSSKDGQGKSQDDGEETVPKRQFIAALHSADEKFNRLKSELDDLKARANRQDAPKVYTRAELKAAVTAGQLSEDAANDLWDRQLSQQVQATATQAATNTITQAEREKRINGDIAAYTRLIPGITQDGHDDRARVKGEFDYLVSLGHPQGVETELAAIRAAFGPIDRLERARAGRPGAEHHREAGASGGSSRPNTSSGKLVDTLTEREKGYYQKQIDSGQYKGWDDVEATLKFARPETRRKHGATV